LYFWYEIKLPCGGWRDFDVRAYHPALESNKPDTHRQWIGMVQRSREDALRSVAEIIAPFDVCADITKEVPY
jgi:hypothetical protein